MEERELAAVAASIAVALLATVVAGPLDWTLDIAVAPVGLELSASFAGARIEMHF